MFRAERAGPSECPICYEAYGVTDSEADLNCPCEPMTLPCAGVHDICRACVSEAFRTTSDPSNRRIKIPDDAKCPICREPVGPNVLGPSKAFACPNKVAIALLTNQRVAVANAERARRRIPTLEADFLWSEFQCRRPRIPRLPVSVESSPPGDSPQPGESAGGGGKMEYSKGGDSPPISPKGAGKRRGKDSPPLTPRAWGKKWGG